MASANAYCDYALYMGATPQNIAIGKTLGKKCAGLKMYLNETFSALQMPSTLDWIAVGGGIHQQKLIQNIF